MLKNDIVVKKIELLKSDNLLVFELESTRYVSYEQNDSLIQYLKKDFDLGEYQPGIVIKISSKGPVPKNMSDIMQDITRYMYDQFKELVLYKDIIEYKIENDILTFTLPDKIEKISDIKPLEKFIAESALRISNKLKGRLILIDDQRADKIEHQTYENILSQPLQMPAKVIMEQADDIDKNSQNLLKIIELDSNVYKAKIEGKITYVKEITTYNGCLIEFCISDASGLITCKRFLPDDKETLEKARSIIFEGNYVTVSGKHQPDRYTSIYYIYADKVSELKLSKRADNAKTKRVELNLNTDEIDVDLLYKILKKWKHEAFGIMPKKGIDSFLKIDEKFSDISSEIKPIYGTTVDVFMQGNTGIFNPYKKKITDSVCTAVFSNDKIHITDIEEGAVKEKQVFKNSDLIGIRDFCKQKPLYIFCEYIDDYICASIAKTGNTVVNIKKVFEILDNKDYTTDSLMLKLNTDITDIPDACKKAINQLMKSYSTYEEICMFTGNYDLKNKESEIFPVSISVKNNEGLNSLFKILTKVDTHFGILPKSYLEAHRYGLLIGSSDLFGELYKKLYEYDSKDSLLSSIQFYDYVNIITKTGFMLHSDEKSVKAIEEFINFNKFLYTSCEDMQKPVVATCFSQHLSKEDMLTTREMLSEFSYLGDKQTKNAVINNTKLIAEQTNQISIMSGYKKKYDVLDNVFIMQHDDSSEQFKKEADILTKSNLSSMIYVIKNILDMFERQDVLYTIEYMPVPYILCAVTNAKINNIVSKSTNDFKIHIQSDMIEKTIDVIKKCSKNFKPFVVNYENHTAVHFIFEGHTIYDFTPMKKSGNELITYFHTDILKKYLPTLIIVKNHDLHMINKMKKSTNIFPDEQQIDSIELTDISVCTNDETALDVLNMIKPVTITEFVRCMGLIYGQGTWHDNAKILIGQKVMELDVVICFEEEMNDPSKDTEAYKEIKRKISSAISYEQAAIHAKNMMIIKWYKKNYEKQFAVEYINRYKDIERFSGLFETITADVSLSHEHDYLPQNDYSEILAPLDSMNYLTEELIKKIVSNRPYVSKDDFVFKNDIDENLYEKMNYDGLTRSLKQSSQISMDI